VIHSATRSPATRRVAPAYASHTAAAACSLEDNWTAGPPFRLVLPRDKRDRLAACAARLARRCVCSVASCGAESLPVLLVEAEVEAVLCPVHQLVRLDGSRVLGEPMLATAVW